MSPECTKGHGLGTALGCGRGALAGFVNVSAKIQPSIFHLVRNSLKYLWELFPLIMAELRRCSPHQGRVSAGLWPLPTPNRAPPASAELRKSDTVPEASDKLDLEGSENNALTTFVFA